MASRQSLADSYGLITRQSALSSGMTPASLQHHLSKTGRWTRALRGVYALQTGPLSTEQRWAAALLYGGGRALLGGPTAAGLHALRAAPRTARVHLLLPHRLRRASHGFVVVRRTENMPDPWSAGPWRVVPVARAVVDSCRDLGRIDDVRALMAEAVQQGRTSAAELSRELDIGASQGSALPRRVLLEVLDGVRSTAEAQAREIVLGSGLPAPLWNVDLFTDSGRWLCRPDAWFGAAGMALEVDSREWHMTPAGWRRTQDRHALMTSYGILVVHVAPARLKNDRRGFLTELRRCHRTGLEQGGAPRVTTTAPTGWSSSP